MLLGQQNGLSSTSAINGGSRGTRDATPSQSIVFIFMQFSENKLCLWGCRLREILDPPMLFCDYSYTLVKTISFTVILVNVYDDRKIDVCKM